MARPKTAFAAWSQYIGARLAEMALTTLNAEAALHLAGGLGRVAYRFDRRHRDRCRQNLRLSFPEWSEQRIEAVTEAAFEHLLKLVFEVCYTPRRIHLDSWTNHARITNLGPALELLNARQPCILLTGHVGNWEALGYMLAVLGYDIHAIARPIDNPLVNDWLMGIRQKRGLHIITKWDATERMLDVLHRGQALGFIADQNAGDKGLFVPFFGRLASTYKSIGLLAMHHDVPVVCGYAHRVERPGADVQGPESGSPIHGRWTMDPGQWTPHAPTFEIGVQDIIYPGAWADQPDPLYYITARYCRALEAMVRKQPGQYLWMHRRWKSRPRHERQGKPMPRRLRQNLEDLPWMTDDLLDQLHQPPPNG